VLKKRTFDAEIVEQVCTLVAEFFKALDNYLINYYNQVQSGLIETFSTNPKNFECLKKVALLVGILGKKEDTVRLQMS